MTEFKVGDKLRVLVDYYNSGGYEVAPDHWRGPLKGDVVEVKKHCDSINQGYWIDSKSVELNRANVYYRYFEILKEEKVKTKFSLGDRVISIIDTPNIPEGFIGHIFSVDKGPNWDYMVKSIKDEAIEYFNEDELELLSSSLETAPVEEAKTLSALDKQVSGDHYKDCKIQPIEYIHANGLNYFEGNSIKYITRHRKKNGKADILKAIHYLELLLELEYKDKE